MALFSLLIAILIERLKLLPDPWQLDALLTKYHISLFGDKQISSEFMMGLAIILPALSVYVLSWVVAGLFWGTLSLALWVVLAVLCFSHQQQRKLFKQYIQAACRGDVQACYHYATELDCNECMDAVSENDLGAKVGQSVAWLNYRYYGAVALYIILLGPIGAVLYCTVRFYAETSMRKSLDLPLVDSLLMLLDWLPSRIFAFGYLLSGHFSTAFSVWSRNALSINTSARCIVTETAIAAETMPDNRASGEANAPICVQSTIALLGLSKRNFILMVTVLSLLTIFGVVN